MNMVSRKEMIAAATLSDPRWAAVVARDPAADGEFFYSVKTTGAYCRPACGARTARPENVAFHATAADAERAGFRPCKRCRPRYRAGGADTEIRFAIGESSLCPSRDVTSPAGSS